MADRILARRGERGTEVAVRDWLVRAFGPGSGVVPMLTVDEDGLAFALREGRFPSGREIVGDVLQEAEAGWFGTAADAPPAACPHYGYLGRASDVADGIRVRLREEVRARTTFLLESGLLPSAVDDPAVASAGPEVVAFYAFVAPDVWDGLAEAQIHGGVDWTDVDGVDFPVDPGDEVLRGLDDAGVSWTIGEATATAETVAATSADPPPAVDDPEAKAGAGTALAGLAGALGASAAAAAPLVIGAMAAKAGADSVAAGTAMVLNALVIYSRGDDTDEIIAATARSTYPDLEPSDIEEVIAQERRMQTEFMRKMRGRVARDLPKALKVADATERRAAIEKIVERERRFIRMRRDALHTRLAAQAEMKRLREVSPQGAFWQLSDSVRSHTPDCVAMAGKVWPWAVLRLYHPPLHAGCPCRLLGIQEAIARGLVKAGELPEAADAVRRAREIVAKARKLEESADPALVDEYLALVEAERRHLLRYARGTTKGGQFRARRGSPAATLRKLGPSGKLLRELVPTSPPGARKRVVRLRGQRVAIPEHRHFERTIDGYKFTSPAGSLNVYRDGVPIEPDSHLDVQDWRLAGRLAVGSPPKEAPAVGLTRDVVSGLKDGHALKGENADAVGAAVMGDGFVLSDSGEGFRAYRHADGSTVTIGVDAAGRVDDAVVERSRVPDASEFHRLGRIPKDWDEAVGDAKAAAGLIAAGTGARWAVGDVTFDATLHDHAGMHLWDSEILVPPRVREDVQDALKRAAEGEVDPYPATTYRAYKVIAHELLHGVNPTGWHDYVLDGNAGAPIEEVLTDELAGPFASELLRQHGLGDVAQWAANNPTHGAVLGHYLGYRAALDEMLNVAHVAPADRPALLWAMKTRMSADERAAHLSQLTGLDPREIEERFRTNRRDDYLPMVTGSSDASLPATWSMNGQQIGRGAVAVLRDGSSQRVVDAGERMGVTFAWVENDRGDKRLVTASDVENVIEPGGGYGRTGRRWRFLWRSPADDTTIAVGDDVDFGDGTAGPVQDLLIRGGHVDAVRVGVADGAVWVTQRRILGDNEITVTPHSVDAASGEPPVVQVGRGQGWQDAGFASLQEAGDEALLLMQAPHLARASDADLTLRLAAMTRLMRRGEAARADSDRGDVERETKRIERLRRARVEAAIVVRRRAAADQRLRDGYLAITPDEFEEAMAGGDVQAFLPDGTFMFHDDLLHATQEVGGPVRVTTGVPSPLGTDAALYRADLLSPAVRLEALRESDSFVGRALGNEWREAAAENPQKAVAAALYARRAGMPIPASLARELGDVRMSGPSRTRGVDTRPPDGRVESWSPVGAAVQGQTDAEHVFVATGPDVTRTIDAFDALRTATRGEDSLVEMNGGLLTMRRLSAYLPDPPLGQDDELKYRAAVIASRATDPPSAYMQAVGWEGVDMSAGGLPAATYPSVPNPIATQGDVVPLRRDEVEMFLESSAAKGLMVVSVPPDERVALESRGFDVERGRSPWGAGVWAHEHSRPEMGDSVPVALRVEKPLRVASEADAHFQERYAGPVSDALRDQGLSEIHAERDRMLRERIMADGYDGVVVDGGREVVAMSPDGARGVERVEFDYSDAPANLTYEQEREFAQTFRGRLGRSVFVENRRNFVPLDEDWSRENDAGTVRFSSPKGTTRIYRQERDEDGWGPQTLASAPRWRRAHPDLRQRRPSAREGADRPIVSGPVPADVAPDARSVPEEKLLPHAAVTVKIDGAMQPAIVKQRALGGSVRVEVQPQAGYTATSLPHDPYWATVPVADVQWIDQEADPQDSGWIGLDFATFVAMADGRAEPPRRPFEWTPGDGEKSRRNLALSAFAAGVAREGGLDPVIDADALLEVRLGNLPETHVGRGMATVYGGLVTDWNAEVLRSPRGARFVGIVTRDAGLPLPDEFSKWLEEDFNDGRLVPFDVVDPQALRERFASFEGAPDGELQTALYAEGFLQEGTGRFALVRPEGRVVVTFRPWGQGGSSAGIETEFLPSGDRSAPPRTWARMLGDMNAMGDVSDAQTYLETRGFVQAPGDAALFYAPDAIHTMQLFPHATDQANRWRLAVLPSGSRNQARSTLLRAGRYGDMLPIGSRLDAVIGVLEANGLVTHAKDSGGIDAATLWPSDGTPARIRILSRDGVIVAVGQPGRGDADIADVSELRALDKERYESLMAWVNGREARTEDLERRLSNIEVGVNPFAGPADRRGRASVAPFEMDEVQRALKAQGMEAAGHGRVDAQGRVTYTFKNPTARSKVILQFERRVVDGVGARNMLVAMKKLEAPGGSLGVQVERIHGRHPANIVEYAGDAVALQRELSEAHGVPVNRREARPSVEFGRGEGFSGLHYMGGRITLGKSVKPALERAIEARDRNERMTPLEMSNTYAAYKVMAHELLHGVRPPRGGDTHSGGGLGIEESVTEELAHPLALRWMGEHGMHDVVQWASEHPEESQVLGSYRQFRAGLRSVFDDAMIPEDQRESHILKMRYEMDGDDRLRYLNDLMSAAGADPAASGRLSGAVPTGNRAVEEFRPVIPANQSEPLRFGQVVTTRDGQVVRLVTHFNADERVWGAITPEGIHVEVPQSELLPVGSGVPWDPNLGDPERLRDVVEPGAIVSVDGRLATVWKGHIARQSRSFGPTKYEPGWTVWWLDDGTMGQVPIDAEITPMTSGPLNIADGEQIAFRDRGIGGVAEPLALSLLQSRGPGWRRELRGWGPGQDAGMIGIPDGAIVPPLIARQGADPVDIGGGVMARPGESITVNGRVGLLWDASPTGPGTFTILQRFADGKDREVTFTAADGAQLTEQRRFVPAGNAFQVRSMEGSDGQQIPVGARVVTPMGLSIVAGYTPSYTGDGWTAQTPRGAYDPRDLSLWTHPEGSPFVTLGDGSEAWVGKHVRPVDNPDEAMPLTITEIRSDGSVILNNNPEAVRQPEYLIEAPPNETDAPRPADPNAPEAAEDRGAVGGGWVSPGSLVRTSDYGATMYLVVTSIDDDGTLRLFDSQSPEHRQTRLPAEVTATARISSGHMAVAGMIVDVADGSGGGQIESIDSRDAASPIVRLVGDARWYGTDEIIGTELPNGLEEGDLVRVNGKLGWVLGATQVSPLGPAVDVRFVATDEVHSVEPSTITKWESAPTTGLWESKSLGPEMVKLQEAVEADDQEAINYASGTMAAALVEGISSAEAAALVRAAGQEALGPPKETLMGALQALYVGPAAVETMRTDHPGLFEWARGTLHANGVVMPPDVGAPDWDWRDPLWAHATFSGVFGRDGLRAAVTQVSAVSSRGQGLQVWGTVMTGDGRHVGTFTRLIYGDGQEVHHSLLKLNNEVQGSGFARGFLAKTFAEYKAAGFDRVTVDAELQNGGYTWAVLGFDLEVYSAPGMGTESDMRKMKLTELVNWARRNGTISPEERERVFGLIDGGDIVTMEDLARVDGMPSGEHPMEFNLGQKILVGNKWSGVKYL